MKKFLGYLFMLSVFILVGCANGDTIYEERTIILNIDLKVTPSFAASFGEGEYDESKGIYTHTISYIKDLYIYISASGYKTKTVYISTAEMKDNTIEKNIAFDTLLDAEILVTIDNVNSLDGLEILEPLNYTDFKIKSKNSFSFMVPTRNENYDIKFRLPNYKDFEISLDSDDLVSGVAKINFTAITFEQVLINLKGTRYEYVIYSEYDNSVVTTGKVYYYDNDNQNIILPNDTGYYINTIDFITNEENLIRVPQDENCIVKFPSNNNSIGYFIMDIGDLEDNRIYLYDKSSNAIFGSSEMYGSLERYGVILEYDSKYYYLENLIDYYNEEKSEDNYNYFDFDLNEFKEVSINLKTVNILTKEENISSFNELSFLRLFGTKDGDTFTFTEEVVNEDEISINLYDKSNNFIATIEYSIPKNFKGKMLDGIVNLNGRNIVYKFPLVLDDLVCENGKYNDLNVNIDADKTLISIYIYDSGKYGSFKPIEEYDDAYLIDDDLNILFPQYINGIAFFEVLPNTNYTLKYNEQKLSINFNENDIKYGVKYLSDVEIKNVKIKYPENYTITIHSVPNSDILIRKDNAIFVPVTSNIVSGSVSNGLIQKDFSFEVGENDEFEIIPFIAINYHVLKLDSIGTVAKEQEYYFYYIDDLSVLDSGISTQYMIIETGRIVKDIFVIDWDKFEFNEELNAYYCDFFQLFTKIINIRVGSFTEDAYPNHLLIGDWLFIIDGYEINVNDTIFDLTKYSSKYLTIVYDNEIHKETIKEVDNPFST